MYPAGRVRWRTAAERSGHRVRSCSASAVWAGYIWPWRRAGVRYGSDREVTAASRVSGAVIRASTTCG